MPVRFQRYLNTAAKAKIAKEFTSKGVGPKITRVLGKAAVPAAVLYESYNTGKKIKEFVGGVKDLNEHYRGWNKQSMSNADDAINAIKNRKKNKRY